MPLGMAMHVHSINEIYLGPLTSMWNPVEIPVIYYQHRSTYRYMYTSIALLTMYFFCNTLIINHRFSHLQPVDSFISLNSHDLFNNWNICSHITWCLLLEQFTVRFMREKKKSSINSKHIPRLRGKSDFETIWFVQPVPITMYNLWIEKSYFIFCTHIQCISQKNT